MATPKETAKQLIDQLPDHASWHDIINELDTQEKIESMLKDIEEGRTNLPEEINASILKLIGHVPR